MSILRVDEEQLKRELNVLPKNLRAVFAAACAQRQLPNYLRFATSTGKGNATIASEAMATIWNELGHRSLAEKALQEMEDRCLALVPDYDEYYLEGQEYADDAIAALVYAIRTLKSGNSQEAELRNGQSSRLKSMIIDLGELAGRPPDAEARACHRFLKVSIHMHVPRSRGPFPISTRWL